MRGTCRCYTRQSADAGHELEKTAQSPNHVHEAGDLDEQ